MIENTGIVRKVNFMKIVHVELPDKRGKLVMPEIPRQKVALQFFLIEYSDSAFFHIPSNSLRILFRLNRKKSTLSMFMSLMRKLDVFYSQSFIALYLLYSLIRSLQNF